MYYGEIKNCDIANGTGVRVTIFVSGCRNKCRGCFQPQTWDFEFGKPYTKETQDSIMKMLEPYYIDGLTLLGGDPFEPENQRELIGLLKEMKEKYPEKNVWAYTGYLYENLIEGNKHPRCGVTDEMLSYIDILVDGPFQEINKNLSLQFRGSSNQRLIDLKKTRERNEIVLADIIKRGEI